MKKITSFILATMACLICHSSIEAWPSRYDESEYSNGRPQLTRDITSEIPDITDTINISENPNFKKNPNVAQYKEADWSQVVGIAHDLNLDQAFKIAEEKQEITYFFYMKGSQMVLEKTDGTYRVFRHGDAVFFGGEPWWGSAPGYSDGYIKIKS